MRSRDQIIVLALVLVVAVATAAALVSAETAGDAPPAFGGTYTEGLVAPSQPQTLDPLFAKTQAERDVAALLFTGLTRFDQRGAVVRDLASDFSASADGKTWTFTIRPDAKWHDGDPVTADDVVYTVGIAQDPAYRGQYAGSFAGAKVTKVDARVVRFELPDVFAPFLEASTMPLLPAHLLRDVGAAQLPRQTFELRPVGTGPFKFEARDETRIVLTRNDSFYREGPERTRPFLDRVILRLFPDHATALQALVRGEVQGVGGLAPSDADRAKRVRDLSTFYFASDEATVLFFNLAPDKPTFRERAVRQAIAYAIDRPRVVRLATNGHASVTDQPVPPSSWAYVVKSSPGMGETSRYAYSPDMARKLLDDNGWVDHDGDGIRDKNGVRLSFSIVTNDDQQRVQTVQQIQKDLSNIGMEVSVEIVPFRELIENRARQRSFDAMVLAVSAGMDPDPYTFWHSSQTKDPGLNFTGYSTLGMDRALEQARRTLDQAQRRTLYAQVFGQLADDVPAIYLYFADYVYLTDRSLKGVRVGPLADPSQRFWSAPDWYVRTVAQE